MDLSFHFWTLFLAIIVDGIVGDPDWLWKKISHPIVWIGTLIYWLDERFNASTDSRDDRRKKGRLVVVFLIIHGIVSGLILQVVIDFLPLSAVFEALIVAIFLSARSLYDHVALVAKKLTYSDLTQARQAVARIVGRDPQTLNRAGISRAAIESLAENFSDGIIAPALWYLAAGLPGLIVYKMINTADSMIGHTSGRHRDFGRATARFDDLINLPASRLTALFCVIGTAIHHGATSAQDAISTIMRDAKKHRSPNAGWPEAAFAGGLDLALSGPRSYGGKIGNEAWINENGRRDLDYDDINSCLTLYLTSLACGTGMVIILGIVF